MLFVNFPFQEKLAGDPGKLHFPFPDWDPGKFETFLGCREIFELSKLNKQESSVFLTLPYFRAIFTCSISTEK